eukprot:26143-Pelagomonas_calceolata.AAC.2
MAALLHKDQCTGAQDAHMFVCFHFHARSRLHVGLILPACAIRRLKKTACEWCGKYCLMSSPEGITRPKNKCFKMCLSFASLVVRSRLRVERIVLPAPPESSMWRKNNRLRVERIVPPAPPEGSMWRKNKLFGPTWVQHQQPNSPEPHAHDQGSAAGLQQGQHQHQHQHLLQGHGTQATSVHGQQMGNGGWDGPGGADHGSNSSNHNTASSSETSGSSSAGGGSYYAGANSVGLQRGPENAMAGSFATNGTSSSSSNGTATTLEPLGMRARRSRSSSNSSSSSSNSRNGGAAVSQYGEGGRVGSMSWQHQQHQQQQRRASPTPDSGGHKYW